MRWTERQRAMLREMGVHLWVHPGDAVEIAVAPTLTTASAPQAETLRAEIRPAPALAAPAPEPAATLAPSLAPADWLVVGEPFDPGDAQQEPLLDNLLRAIGVARRANTRERRAVYLALAGATAPEGAAASADAAALAAAIERVAPRCIVALGRGAAALLLGSDAPLGHWRGRCHERGATPVVVTFSLAFLLRHPADKAKAWADLCLAVGARLPAG
jgi:uracil-DNA glycosylase family 4